MVYKIFRIGRILLQAILLAIFFYFFGLPAIEKFQLREVTNLVFFFISDILYPQIHKNLLQVMVVHTTKETEGIPAPTISIFPYNKNNSLIGTLSQQMEEMYQADLPCEDFLIKKTVNQSDALIDIFIGSTRRMSLLGEENIMTEELTRPSFGRYYVFKPSFTIGTDYKLDQIYLVLFRHLNYVIQVYDPRFYLGFFNPSIPMFREIVKPDDTVGKYHVLVLTEVRVRYICHKLSNKNIRDGYSRPSTPQRCI